MWIKKDLLHLSSIRCRKSRLNYRFYSLKINKKCYFAYKTSANSVALAASGAPLHTRLSVIHYSEVSGTSHASATNAKEWLRFASTMNTYTSERLRPRLAPRGLLLAGNIWRDSGRLTSIWLSRGAETNRTAHPRALSTSLWALHCDTNYSSK